MTMTRRNFIKTTSCAVGTASLLNRLSPSLRAAALANGMPLGFQTWTLRDQLGQDLPGTLRMMADMGYEAAEFCSPRGYTNTPFEKFAGMPAKELRQVIADTGLSCQSSHFNMMELREHLDDRITWARNMGLTQMITSSFWLPKGASVDDYRRSCDELNVIAAKIKAAGLQSGFHNHNMEFERQNGVLIYDAMLERLDPSLVKMQFQVAAITSGYKAADFFRKYPGRFISSHLSDWSAEKHEMPIGQGIVDWKDFFDAAKVAGVRNIFVEMDPGTFKESARYLRALLS